MGSRRCTVCAIEWPCLDEFKTCPECAGSTWVNHYGVPNVVEDFEVNVDEDRINVTVERFRDWLDSGVTADQFDRGL